MISTRPKESLSSDKSKVAIEACQYSSLFSIDTKLSVRLETRVSFIGGIHCSSEDADPEKFLHPYRLAPTSKERSLLMTVRLRLAVHGKRNNRIFHLVAIDNRKRRDAKPIEKLGVYNPRRQENQEKTVEWNVQRIKDWLAMGAQPTQTFVRLMQKVGVSLILGFGARR